MSGQIQRAITAFAPGKTYSGFVDIPNESLRSIDLLNSASIYWRDPAEKNFEDAILFHDATIILENTTKLTKMKRMQVRLRDVVFFYDSLEGSGDRREQIRAATLKTRSGEDNSTVNIITHTLAGSFFFITGVFYGLFKSKSKQRYIPLTKATVTEVIRSPEGWQKKKIPLPTPFVGVSTSHIEACSFKDYQL